MTVGVFDHPVLGGLLGHPQIAELFSVEQDIKYMLMFESALARAQSALEIIPDSAAAAIVAHLSEFTPDITKLREHTAVDGVVVPELVRQIRQQLDPDVATYFHYGATSQDVIDTSLVLRLKMAVGTLEQFLGELLHVFEKLEENFGSNQLMARTRMQNAISSSASEQLTRWRLPLEHSRENANRIVDQFAIVQYGGAIGERILPDGKSGQELAVKLGQLLDLNNSNVCWHSDRTGLTELADWLSRLSGHLGKIGRDVVLLNINEVADIELSGAGTSSAMAHKSNPVKAEVLETLALFNATQLSAMHHALVHEHRRSGSRWTLEWMILPQMVLASAAGIRNACELLHSITRIGKNT